MTLVAGYPVLFNLSRPVQGVPGVVETVSPGVQLRPAAVGGVDLRLNHDHTKVIARPGDLGYVVETDDAGIRIAFLVPATRIGIEVEDLIKAGHLGGSFGWAQRFDGTVVRWHVDERPVRREILAVEIREVSLTRSPAFPQTWVIGGELAAKLEQHARQRTWACRVPSVTPPDVLVNLPFRSRQQAQIDTLADSVAALLGVEKSIQREHELVQRTLKERPGVGTIDIRYPRTIASALRRQERRAAGWQTGGTA